MKTVIILCSLIIPSIIFAEEPKIEILMFIKPATCEPCRFAERIVDPMIKDGYNITKVDIDISDANKKLKEDYKIHFVPTYVILKDGKETERHEGGASKERILKWLEK